MSWWISRAAAVTRANSKSRPDRSAGVKRCASSIRTTRSSTASWATGPTPPYAYGTTVRSTTATTEGGAGPTTVGGLEAHADARIAIPAGKRVELYLAVGQAFVSTVDVDLQNVTVRTTRLERDHLTGEIGDGKGRIRIETGSGGVRLVRTK